MRHFLLVVLLILSMGTMSFGKMVLQYQWKYLDLVWESPQQKQKAIDSGAYNASSFYMYDVDRAPDGRVFITTMKEKGTPVSLLTVTNQQGEGGPLLRPYPDWTWYKDDCEGIIAVFQVDIKCNHLFVVDAGRFGCNYSCPPKLLIFDLSNDKLVKRVNIPVDIAEYKIYCNMLISSFAHAPDCRNVKNNTNVFIADTKGELLIYNIRTSTFRRIKSDLMNITNTDFVIDNVSYLSLFGITGLTLIDKYLYYAAFVGNKIYKVEYSKLMECSINDICDHVDEQIKLVGALGGQTVTLTSDRCAIFFSDITNISLICADGTKEINSNNKEVIANDSKLKFLTGMKIRNGALMVLSSNFYQHEYNDLNINEINFRISSIPIKEVEKDTNCFSSCKH